MDGIEPSMFWALAGDYLLFLGRTLLDQSALRGRGSKVYNEPVTYSEGEEMLVAASYYISDAWWASRL